MSAGYCLLLSCYDARERRQLSLESAFITLRGNVATVYRHSADATRDALYEFVIRHE